MWQVATTEITGGRRYELCENENPMSFRRMLERLSSDDDFADWFSDTLASFEADACYWEMPPLSANTIDKDAEFVLIDAPSLARRAAEPGAFASYFRSTPGENVVVFANLGGDATLVAPCPCAPNATYPHLAAFLRRATADQVRALWRATAGTVLAQLGSTPIWLSTAGDGIAWLHVRLDSRPKYYCYGPYKIFPAS
jgi:hypothetical protein